METHNPNAGAVYQRNPSEIQNLYSKEGRRPKEEPLPSWLMWVIVTLIFFLFFLGILSNCTVNQCCYFVIFPICVIIVLPVAYFASKKWL
jgi:hypothetical protein